ncbi:5,6-dimethylbenzimidazole synthase [Methylocella sp.]|uniref:5,6-dimethylbenzimidazole synthase n=1 Tax=Methylocella sp. TaxID=1978226 RepID=UPI003783E141
MTGAGAAEAPPVFDEDFLRALDALFRWRRDVRRFRPDPLPAGLLERLLEAAAQAPSVGASQPWRFVSVESAARRGDVLSSFLRCNEAALKSYEGERARLYASLKLAGLKEAPVHLAVFCDHAAAAGHGLGRATMPETLDYSVVAAVHALWLAARARGLGVGWVSILDPFEIAAALEVPAGWKLVAYLCVGYPQEEHADPELERAGWQARLPGAARLLRR